MNKIQKTIYLDEDLVKNIKIIAIKESTTESNIIQKILKENITSKYKIIEFEKEKKA